MGELINEKIQHVVVLMLEPVARMRQLLELLPRKACPSLVALSQSLDQSCRILR
jgi:hypothetical protein